MSISEILSIDNEKIHTVDIGAAFFGKKPPYQPLIDHDLCHLYAFEPDEREIKRVQNLIAGYGELFPFAIGDGKEHTMHLCPKNSGMSSLLEPDKQSLKFFNLFEAFGKIESTTSIKTEQLNNVNKIPQIDYLKMDTQGSELSVLVNGWKKLKDCVLFQMEVSFITLYKNQAPFGIIDTEMRKNGFIPHMFSDVKRWSIAPTKKNNNPRIPFNQLLEADIVYICDIMQPENISNIQLKKLAIISDMCYGSIDLAARCLIELQSRNAVSEHTLSEYMKIVNNRT